MVNSYWRRKTCKHQSRKKADGSITCKKDSSRRKVDTCYQGKCQRWKPTALGCFHRCRSYDAVRDAFNVWKRRKK